MFAIGQKVRIKAEFRDTGESASEYQVISEANVMGRVDISPVEWSWPIRPIESVAAYMLESA